MPVFRRALRAVRIDASAHNARHDTYRTKSPLTQSLASRLRPAVVRHDQAAGAVRGILNPEPAHVGLGTEGEGLIAARFTLALLITIGAGL